MMTALFLALLLAAAWSESTANIGALQIERHLFGSAAPTREMP
jgi:hypothetical protein